MWETISSGDIISPIDSHFRVKAGPGAGKTYWLSNHIRHVTKNSTRLSATSKIACISYTNVAVSEILGRLKECGHVVEGGTIHSFLYKNVVRPYAHLLRHDDGAPVINHSKIHGHDIHRPTRDRVKRWLAKEGSKPGVVAQLTKSAWPETCSYLMKLSWRFDQSGNWGHILPRAESPKLFPIRKLGTYKEIYWSGGIIDHDDVLYFAHRILSDFPEVVHFLACRFPYIFVDEFQDTNPVQTQVLKLLADKGTSVGVIGDPAQAIFGFQGAESDGFEKFILKDQKNYQIDNNRRSVNTVVELLNRTRKDGLIQNPVRDLSGESIVLLTGDKYKAVEKAREILGEKVPLVILARENKEVAAFRNCQNGGSSVLGQWKSFRNRDYQRALFVERLGPSIIQARTGRFAIAVDEVAKTLCHRNGFFRKPITCDGKMSKTGAQGIALSILEFATGISDEVNLKDAYNAIGDLIMETTSGVQVSKITSGQVANEAEAINFNELIRSMPVVEETRDIRTIHKAKGAEFDAVLVSIDDLRVFQSCCDKSLKSKEEERLLYVAFSRAKDRLFIHMAEEPSQVIYDSLDKIPIEIHRFTTQYQPTLFSE